MGTWQLQEAKARLSEVIKKAAKEGPQSITVHGEPSAVVISRREYDRLKHPQGSFVEFMRRSPLYGVELDPHAGTNPHAATVLHHDLRLVTRNAGDFDYPGLEVVNPWSSAP